jgi:hypothetical protein
MVHKRNMLEHLVEHSPRTAFRLCGFSNDPYGALANCHLVRFSVTN